LHKVQDAGNKRRNWSDYDAVKNRWWACF